VTFGAALGNRKMLRRDSMPGQEIDLGLAGKIATARRAAERPLEHIRASDSARSRKLVDGIRQAGPPPANAVFKTLLTIPVLREKGKSSAAAHAPVVPFRRLLLENRRVAGPPLKRRNTCLESNG
jgi:hypothetical protein